MEDRRVLIDTSIIIDFLRKDKKDKTFLWKIKNNSTCFMSSITFFELLSGVKTERHFEDLKKISKWIKSLNFDDNIAFIAADIYKKLRKNNKIIDYRDIFIAATANYHNLIVATINKGHFERIEDITLLNLDKDLP